MISEMPDTTQPEFIQPVHPEPAQPEPEQLEPEPLREEFMVDSEDQIPSEEAMQALAKWAEILVDGSIAIQQQNLDLDVIQPPAFGIVGLAAQFAMKQLTVEEFLAIKSLSDHIGVTRNIAENLQETYSEAWAVLASNVMAGIPENLDPENLDPETGE
jgi:hypothetical protein